MSSSVSIRNKVLERFWNEVGSADFESLWRVEGDTLRISIKRDNEEPRSFAILDIYDTVGRRWNKLAFLPYEHMKSVLVRPYRKGRTSQDEALFREDEQALLRLGDMILGWERGDAALEHGNRSPADRTKLAFSERAPRKLTGAV